MYRNRITVTLTLFLTLTLTTGCEKLLMGDDTEPSASENFAYLWQQVDERYSLFDVKDVDWQAMYDSLAPQVFDGMSNDSLFAVLSKLLNSLDDGHVNLWGNNDVFGSEAIYLQKYGNGNFDLNTVALTYLRADHHTTGGFAYNTIANGRVLYIRYSSFSNSAATSQITSVINRYPDISGIVFDIRQNGGGEIQNEFQCTFSFQVLNDPEQGLDFVRGQGGGRLVQYQHPAVGGYSLGDFHGLHLGNAQLAHLLLRIEVHPNPLEQVRRIGIHFCMVDHRNKAQGFFHGIAAKEDILADGPGRNRLKFLVHHGDPLAQGIHGVVDRNGLAVHQDLAGIHLVNAEHTLHQGGFSGAVFSHQGVHFAGPKLQLHIIQRLNAWENLADAGHFQHVFGHEGMPPLSLVCSVPFAPGPSAGPGAKGAKMLRKGG